MPRRIATPAGVALEKWADSAFPIVWRLNTAKGSNITGSRDLADVARESFQAWDIVETSRVSFHEGSPSPLTNAAFDQVNLISFVPTNYASDAPVTTILYSFTAPGTDSFGRPIEFPGQIVEADFIFNPNVQFSADFNAVPGLLDLQSRLTHEIGHLLGLDHSALVSAVMSSALLPGSLQQRTLSKDDIIGVSNIYPLGTFLSLRGGIRGTVRTAAGSPIGGAHVVIVDSEGRPVTSTLSDADGIYRVRGLEAGNYAAYAEPFDVVSVSDPFPTRFGVFTSDDVDLAVIKAGGDQQSGRPGESLATPLEIEVRNSTGSLLTGVSVSFVAASGGGTVIPLTSVTDAQGRARTTAYLGTGATQTFGASVSSVMVTFTASVRYPDVPAPSITAVTPANVIRGVSMSVTLTGENFVKGATTVSISGSGVAANDVQVVSSIMLRATFVTDSQAAMGARSFTVATPSGPSNSREIGIADVASISVLDGSSVETGEIVVNEGNSIRPRLRVRDTTGAAHDQLSSSAFTYTPIDPEVASISAGVILGKKVGFTTLSVALRGVIGKATVNVVQIASSTPESEVGGVVQDLAGRLYMAASQDHVILRAESLGLNTVRYAGRLRESGYGDDVRLNALFNSPAFLAFNQADGTLYVSDSANNRIRRVRAGIGGRVETLTGTGAAGATDGPLNQATFNNPQGLALDNRGNLWVADSGNHVIRVIDLRAGTVRTVAGQAGSAGYADGTGTQARFDSPVGIAIEAETVPQELRRFFRAQAPVSVRLVVADSKNGLIRRVTESGEVSTLGEAGANPLNSGDFKAVTTDRSASILQFQLPLGIAVDQLGNIYFTEPASGQIRVILPNGNVVSAVQADSRNLPKGLAIGKLGKVLVAASNKTVRELRYGQPEITSISPDTVSVNGGTQVTVKGRNFAPGAAVVVEGTIITAVNAIDTETLSFTVPAFPSGRVTLTVATRGGLAQAPLLIAPLSLNSLPARHITTVAGGSTFLGDGGPAFLAALSGPHGLAVDGNGDLFIADRLNDRIRKVDSRTLGITSVAGLATSGTIAENDLALTAHLESPQSIGIDSAGNTYIDSGFFVYKIDGRTGKMNTLPCCSATVTHIITDAAGNVYFETTKGFGSSKVHKLAPGATTTVVIAGGGQPLDGVGDGLAATQALIVSNGIALDSAGNLYIADTDHNRIRKVDGAGVISTVAGTGQTGTTVENAIASATPITAPQGLAIDPEGSLYFGSATKLYKIDVGGVVTSVASFSTPIQHIVSDAAGNIYVSEGGGLSYDSTHRIYRIDGRTKAITAWAGSGARYLGDNGPATGAAMLSPAGITVHTNGDLYIADSADYRIRKVEANTQRISTVAGTGKPATPAEGSPAVQSTILSPVSVAVDRDGNVYFRDSGFGDSGKIRRVDAVTGNITTLPISAPLPSFNRNLGLTFGPNGDLYYPTSNNRIARYNAQSGVTFVAGSGASGSSSSPKGDGGPALSGFLLFPLVVGFDAVGNLYIADYGNSRIRKVDAATDIITTVAGGGTSFLVDGVQATEAQLLSLRGMAVDPAGNIFILETVRLRRVDAATGIITTIMHCPGFSGDGGPAADACFDGRSLALDTSGNLFISDTPASRIRVIRGPLN